MSHSCLSSSRPARFQAVAGVLLLPLICASSLLAAPATSPTVLQMQGDIAQSYSWTLPQLQKLAPTQTIRTTLKGKPYTARGINLWTLLQKASLKLDPKLKHSEARFVVLVHARDGYTSAFSWPELMTDTGNKAAFIVWEANGKPLSAKEGSFRLVVPGDKKPMRWVHNLASIEIYDGHKLRLPL